MNRFKDKVVVITGGTSGIGLATARRFLSEGAQVVITGRTGASLAQAAQELGGKVTALAADVANVSEIEALFSAVKAKFGHIDILFANAGMAKLAPVDVTSESMFDEIVSVNFKGAYFTAQKALPLLVDGGSVVFTTSWFGDAGVAGTSVVSATKAAVRNFVRTLASELLGRRIRVNAVSPGVIETPLFGKLGLAPADVDAMGAALLAKIPSGRFGSADEIAGAVAFLASPDATYITGVELAIDGGLNQL